MKDNIALLSVILVLAGAFFGFCSALTANNSTQEARKKTLPPIGWIIYTVGGAAIGALFSFTPTWIYVIILILLAILQFLNYEGRTRMISWFILVAITAFVLILSVVYNRGESGFKPAWLLWLIPIAIPIISGFINQRRLDVKSKLPNGKKAQKKPKEKKKMDRVDLVGYTVAISIIAVLIVSIIIVGII